MVRNKDVSLQYTHTFPTPLTKYVLHNAIMEVLKYILYARFQIPFPLATLKQQYAKEKNKQAANAAAAISSVPNVRTKSYRAWCKLAEFVENFVQISEAVSLMVERCNVRKVVLLLGSTVVSPKETFVVTVNGTDSTASEDELPASKSASICRNLLKGFVIEDIFGGLPAKLAPKKMFVAVCVEEETDFCGGGESQDSPVFLPRASFSEPTRGAVHYINLETDRSACEVPSEQLEQMEIADSERSHCSSDGCSEQETDNSISSTECTSPSVGFWYLSCLPLNGFKG